MGGGGNDAVAAAHCRCHGPKGRGEGAGVPVAFEARVQMMGGCQAGCRQMQETARHSFALELFAEDLRHVVVDVINRVEARELPRARRHGIPPTSGCVSVLCRAPGARVWDTPLRARTVRTLPVWS